MENESSVEYWDRQAENFDAEPDHGLSEPQVRNAWRALLRSVLPAPPAKILDVGCGTGSLSVLLAELGYGVTGIDSSAAMIAAATAKANSHLVIVAFSLADASQLSPELAGFDALVARHILWALPDPQASLRSWTGALRPGGRMVLVEGRWSTGSGLGADAVTALLARLGLESESMPLTDADLWGKKITDERYALVANA